LFESNESDWSAKQGSQSLKPFFPRLPAVA
jgi:hypothetical protein